MWLKLRLEVSVHISGRLKAQALLYLAVSQPDGRLICTPVFCNLLMCNGACRGNAYNAAPILNDGYRTSRFAGATQSLAKRTMQYYRISQCTIATPEM